MDINRPMTLLLIEDNPKECETFKKYIKNRDDVRLVGITNSSIEGIEHLKTFVPEGIILDMELNNGKGSGLDFIMEFNKLYMEVKPLIFVTTNTETNKMYNFLHKNNVDFIFYKKKEDYSVELIVNTFLFMRDVLYTEDNVITINPVENIDDFKNKVIDKINVELDLVGIGRHLAGRSYLCDAIYFLAGPDHNNTQDTVFNHLAKQYKIASGSVSRAMQTAINYAWKRTAIDELSKYYTAKVYYGTGVPSPTEFIYYYEGKINKFLEN